MTRGNIPKIEVDTDSIGSQELDPQGLFPQNQEKPDLKRGASPRLGAQAIGPLIARSVSFAVVDPRSMDPGGRNSTSIPGSPTGSFTGFGKGN